MCTFCTPDWHHPPRHIPIRGVTDASARGAVTDVPAHGAESGVGTGIRDGYGCRPMPPAARMYALPVSARYGEETG